MGHAMPAHVADHVAAPAPVTLAPLRWLRRPELVEIAEPAARLAETRTIKAGIDAWGRVGGRATFDDWCQVGAALLIGRKHALALSGAARPIGRRYSLAFSTWLTKHGFGAMEPSVRSAALDLAEHLDTIVKWRGTLPEKQRQQLIHPLSNVQAWRRAARPQEARPKVDIAAALCRLATVLRHVDPEQAELPIDEAQVVAAWLARHLRWRAAEL